MKIAVMAHFFAPSTGGIEITAELLARGFAVEHGDDVTVVTHTRERMAGEESLPYRVLRAPSPRQLWRVIRQSDVVFHNNPCLRFYWPHLLLQRPWVVTMRSWLVVPGEEPGPVGRVKIALKARLIARADVLLANSHGTAERTPGARAVVLNSYRDHIFTLTGPQQRERTRVVYVGRLLEHKGVQLLLDAAAALRREGHDLHVTIVGDGVHRSSLEQRSRSLGLESAVTFVGEQPAERVAEILNENAVLVLPSLMPETFGTVLVEAAACGVVPVASDHGGSRDAVGEAGVLFDPFEPAALTDALRGLLEDGERFESLRSRLAEHAAQFSGRRMVQQYRGFVEAARDARTARSTLAAHVPLNRPVARRFLPPHDSVEPGGQTALLLLAREPTGPRTGRTAVLEAAVRGLQEAEVDVRVLALTSAEGPGYWLGAPISRVAPPSSLATARAVVRAAARRRTLNSAVFDHHHIRRRVALEARQVGAHVVVADGLRVFDLARGTGLPVLIHLDDLLSERYADGAFVDGNASLLGYYGSELTPRVRMLAERVVRRAMRREARLARQEEIEVARRGAVTAMTSAAEARELAERAGAPVEFLPMAVEESTPGLPHEAPADTAVFVGALHYGPNIGALRFLQNEVFPELRKRGRSVQVDVVGLIGDNDLGEFSDPFFRFVGYAPDLAQALAGHRMLLSPVRAGTGVKTKVLDGMAVSLPVVATTLGAAGVPLQHGRDALIADSPMAYADAMVDLMDDPELARRIGDAGCHVLRTAMASTAVHEAWHRAFVTAKERGAR